MACYGVLAWYLFSCCFRFVTFLRLCSWNICLLASSSHLKEYLERKLASLIKPHCVVVDGTVRLLQLEWAWLEWKLEYLQGTARQIKGKGNKQINHMKEWWKRRLDWNLTYLGLQQLFALRSARHHMIWASSFATALLLLFVC